jgi:hypothetical protein
MVQDDRAKGPTVDEVVRHGPSALVAEWDRLRAMRAQYPRRLRLAGSVPRPDDAALDELALQLRSVSGRLWQWLIDQLVAGDLILSWQPPDPTAGRQTLAADRCAYLRLPRGGKRDRLFLDDGPLDHVLIHRATAPSEQASDPRPADDQPRLIEREAQTAKRRGPKAFDAASIRMPEQPMAT